MSIHTLSWSFSAFRLKSDFPSTSMHVYTLYLPTNDNDGSFYRTKGGDTHSQYTLTTEMFSYKYLMNHSTVALNAPSRPAFTFGLLMSPRTANPCVHPSQYVLSYPGACFPLPRISSPIFCFSAGYISSTSQELISNGTFVFANFSRSAGTSSKDGCETTAALITPSKARSKT